MAAKKSKSKPEPGRTAQSLTLLAVLVKALLGISVVGGVIAAIIWLGGQAGEQVVHQARYTIPFSRIQCEAPPESDRLAFLTEVRYLNNLPESLQSVEPGLAERLKAAFSKHPWVSQVEDVKISPDASIEVKLTYREIALLVQVTGEAEWRAVDRRGILLPGNAKPGQHPQLINTVLAPTRPAGEIWDDPTIRRAAELVHLYQDQKPSRIEKTAKGWRLTLSGGRVVLVSL